MPKDNSLPRGIRQNNPGNLRRGCLTHTTWTTEAGFARFRTPHDGLENLAYQLWLDYHVHKRTTVAAIMSSYAPPSENDTALYTGFVGEFLRIKANNLSNHDIHLDRMWHMVDFMRGIIAFENGWPPPKWSVGGEWFSPRELQAAYESIGLLKP